MNNQEAIEAIKLAQAQIEWDYPMDYTVAFDMAISALQVQDLQPTCNQFATDCVSRQAAIYIASGYCHPANIAKELAKLPSAQPERTWYPVTEPPNHHNDVIVRGIEAIGNVTVYKIMQWDVDTWRPADYAPSIVWKEWSEI